MQLRAEEILRIAEDGSNDWMDVETRSGRMVRQLDHEHVKRSELRIKTRQWLMTRFAPKVFGDRLQLDASKETREMIAAQSDQERLEGALALIARAKRRVADAFAAGRSARQISRRSAATRNGERRAGAPAGLVGG